MPIGAGRERRLGRELLRACVALALACAAHACSSDVRQRERGPVRTAATDRTSRCADLSELRVCWAPPEAGSADERGANRAAIYVTPRPIPAGAPLSPLGWRCAGAGGDRICFDRQKGVGAFARSGEMWKQRHPRLPDDGEWVCEDMAGAATCSGGDAAAGIAMNVFDPAWICGTRRPGRPTAPAGSPRSPVEGPPRDSPERVCVDLAPDFPDGRARGWRCRYATENGLVRICERDGAAHQLGDPCNGRTPCLDGLRCVDEKCVPERPAPSCVFDRDCDRGVCRLGTCVEPDR